MCDMIQSHRPLNHQWIIEGSYKHDFYLTYLKFKTNINIEHLLSDRSKVDTVF